MWERLPVKYQLFLSDLIKLEFSRQIFKKKEPKYIILSKSVQWESSCSMLTDGRTNGQTDMTKLKVAFRNFANASKMLILQIGKMGYT